VAILMSMAVAFAITPWLSHHMLRGVYEKEREEKPFVLEESPMYKVYSRVMHPLFEKRSLRLALLGIVFVLFGFAILLVVVRYVPLKMLPFDNKNELQVVVDMPEGTTLENTEAATHALSDYLVRVPEVTDVTTYAGTHSPVDFNGLIRQYYLREGPHVADIRVNLVEKKHRSQKSHAIGLRLRNDLKEIARRHNANIKIVETPPGPPVIATVVAEVYGRVGTPYEKLAEAAQMVRGELESVKRVVDVDDVLVARQPKRIFLVDRTKAALSGISPGQIASAMSGAVHGTSPTSLRLNEEVYPVNILLRLPREQRDLEARLLELFVKNPQGEAVFLSELGTFQSTVIDQPIYYKNLQPVVYVFGDTAGLSPPEAILTLSKKVDKNPNLKDFYVKWSGEGEWKITLRVFRDLGVAFAVAVLGIYIILLYQTESYLLPIIQLIALPLSMIGIFPGFWLLNIISGRYVNGWYDPVYFTATAMIGMIALAGIATRNAILLIEFVEERKKKGTPLRSSLIEAGALRTRPIFLTSFTAMLAAWPITLDPIFSGLAWALIFGITVSAFFTLIVIPIVYYMIYRRDSD
jgi:multidrug efflux pump subunit AcrB